MSSYVNISLDLSLETVPLMDLRVPRTMTLGELLQTVSESYGLGLVMNNPVARLGKGGRVLTIFQDLEVLRDGDLLVVEAL